MKVKKIQKECMHVCICPTFSFDETIGLSQMCLDHASKRNSIGLLSFRLNSGLVFYYCFKVNMVIADISLEDISLPQNLF